MDIKEVISQLYGSEDISVGVHGTDVSKDPEQKLAKSILKNGLMSRSYDLRRTISFQDRGKIHAHGNTPLETLLAYKFSKQNIGYVYEEKITEGKIHEFIPKQIDLDQCSFLVAIPKELSTTDADHLYTGPVQEFDRGFARDQTELRLGTEHHLKGRPLDPKYIIGYYMNGDISTFVANDQFYGFSIDENGELHIDWDKVREENEKMKQINAEKETKTAEELGRETLEQQTKTPEKRSLWNKIKDLVNTNDRTQEK